MPIGEKDQGVEGAAKGVTSTVRCISGKQRLVQALILVRSSEIWLVASPRPWEALWVPPGKGTQLLPQFRYQTALITKKIGRYY